MLAMCYPKIVVNNQIVHWGNGFAKNMFEEFKGYYIINE
jgi:hypothetical protein